MAMITIYCCNRGSKEIDEYGNFAYHYADKSKHKQWRYIKDINKTDGCIATMPHSESVLRKYFIAPHLDKAGYLKEFGKFILELSNNFSIEYELVDKSMNLRDWEERLLMEKSYGEISKEKPIPIIDGAFEWYKLK